MNDFVAYSSRRKIALLVLVSLVFVSIGLWMIGTFGAPPESRKYSPEMMFIFGWVVLVFCGFCGAVLIKRLFDSREQIRIGSSGIRPSPRYDYAIPWSEISDVTSWQYRGQKMIILHLRDPARFPQKGMPAFVVKANKLLSGGDIAVNLTGTDRSFDEAMLAVEQFKE